MSIQGGFKIAAVTILASTLACAQTAAGKAPWFNSDTIKSPQVLADIADVLERRYGHPVAYEDPVWGWDGEAELHDVGRDAGRGSSMYTVPIWQTFHLPADIARTPPDELSLSLLQVIVDEYNRQSRVARFRVAESKFGLHIVPWLAHDRDGRMAPAHSAMDTVISIREETRTASAHFEAIFEAVSQIQGFRVDAAAIGIGENWFEKLFDAPGGTLTWGVTAVTAREALADLLNHSATSFSWRLSCEPSSLQHRVKRCVMNLQPIRGAAALTRLEYDRRKK